MSPTQRTLALLRSQGFKPWVVERFLGYAGKFGKRQDMYGIIDVIAILPDETLGVQCCSGTGSEHWNKLTDEKNQECRDWIANPDRKLQIWGWRQLRKKGLTKAGKKKKGKIWVPKILNITLEDLEDGNKNI